MSKKAILLMAYGSPERDEDIEPYFTDIRRGRKPTKEELDNLRARYKVIGGHSPLLKITQSTASKLEEALRKSGKDVRVYAGMKHWHPYISEEFERISSDGVTDLLCVALAPHYSKMSIATYQDAVLKANSAHGDKAKLEWVNQWHLDPVFIAKWLERIDDATRKKFRAPRDKIFFLFTAHSLPERILAMGDPYKTQLLETADRLAKGLNLKSVQYGFSFQSAGHTSEPWLGPDILDKLKALAKQGWKEILVAPIGFVSDHLEILFDLDKEARDLAVQLGVHLERTESFNDSGDFIQVLHSVVSATGFV